MKTHPMIFNKDMVRALLSGCKTQTRRPVKPQPPSDYEWHGWMIESSNRKHEGCASWKSKNLETHYAKPPCKPNDLIWVRETFRLFNRYDECGCEAPCECPSHNEPRYRASHNNCDSKWKPSIHMPQSASRLTLRVLQVRLEQVQDISTEDACAEGFKLPPAEGQGFAIGARTNFRHAWQAIYPGSWERNQWVWVIDFEVIESNINQVLKDGFS
ncbi:hypothetical protein [Bermanella sp. R86510]|uniref:hypothetical protein n=1 Tax=unclassified Bermanella TaxID=2627862 RepID=UPI0037C6D2ED